MPIKVFRRMALHVIVAPFGMNSYPVVEVILKTAFYTD